MHFCGSRSRRHGCGCFTSAPRFQDQNGISYSLLDFTPNAPAPTRDVAGGRIYSLSAQYVYAMSRPQTVSEGLLVGALPWDKFGANVAIMDTSQVFNIA